MSLLAKEPEGGGNFERVPEGVYTARCYMILDIGTHIQSVKDNSGEPVDKSYEKVLIGFELLGDEKKEDGTPFTIEKRYTNSLWETSALYKDLNAWRGKAFTDEELKGFDLSKIIDAYCFVQVAHAMKNNKTYANISSIMALPKGADKPKGTLKPVILDFSMGAGEFVTTFNGLRDYYKLLVQDSLEFSNNKADWEKKGCVLATRNASFVAPSGDVVIQDLDEATPVDLDSISF